MQLPVDYNKEDYQEDDNYQLKDEYFGWAWEYHEFEVQKRG